MRPSKSCTIEPNNDLVTVSAPTKEVVKRSILDLPSVSLTSEVGEDDLASESATHDKQQAEKIVAKIEDEVVVVETTVRPQHDEEDAFQAQGFIFPHMEDNLEEVDIVEADIVDADLVNGDVLEDDIAKLSADAQQLCAITVAEVPICHDAARQIYRERYLGLAALFGLW
jgi:hypothetical protein